MLSDLPPSKNLWNNYCYWLEKGEARYWVRVHLTQKPIFFLFCHHASQEQCHSRNILQWCLTVFEPFRETMSLTPARTLWFLQGQRPWRWFDRSPVHQLTWGSCGELLSSLPGLIWAWPPERITASERVFPFSLERIGAWGIPPGSHFQGQTCTHTNGLQFMLFLLEYFPPTVS